MEIERRMMSIRFEYRHWCLILARNAVGQTLKNFFICKNEKKKKAKLEEEKEKL